MRINHLSVLAALILGSLIVQSTLTVAAEKQADKPVAVKKAGETLAQQLKLTSEQKEKLKPILQEERKKLAALRDKTDLTPKQRREQRREIVLEIINQVKDAKILTDEQIAKWKELRAQQPSREGKKRQKTS
jgi:hypothetical protein